MQKGRKWADLAKDLTLERPRKMFLRIQICYDWDENTLSVFANTERYEFEEDHCGS